MAELDDDTAEGIAAHLWLTNPPEPVGTVDPNDLYGVPEPARLDVDESTPGVDIAGETDLSSVDLDTGEIVDLT